MNAFCFYLSEQKRKQRRDGQSGSLPEDAATDDGDPHSEMDRAFIVSVVRQALRDTQRICSEKGLDDHMQIFVRHYYDGQPYQAVASDFDVEPSRAAVMARSAARNFKAALRDLLSCDGAASGEIDAEIESLLETASDE